MFYFFFKDLLTKHKDVVSQYLKDNYIKVFLFIFEILFIFSFFCTSFLNYIFHFLEVKITSLEDSLLRYIFKMLYLCLQYDELFMLFILAS
jgi:hypothetical protein